MSDDAGILLLRDDPKAKALAAAHDIPHAFPTPDGVLPFERTLIWDPVCPLSGELLAVGLRFVERWDVAVPIADLKVLACDVGTDAERARTKAITRDLRTPIYETRVLFLRRGDAADALLCAWFDERADGGHEGLAFARALYTTRSRYLALPPTWVNGRAA